MTEKLLHFIWQFQYLNKTGLTTQEGEELVVLNQGTLNTNQGPDFLQATIKINTIILVGNIELHINSSDWINHKHNNDENYNNVILHVVWNHDKEIKIHKTTIPVLELKNLVPKILLQQYKTLMNNEKNISCYNFLPALSNLSWLAWKESLVAERLEEKSKNIIALLAKTNHHWEEVFWRLLAGNFGIKINKESFEEIAQTISVNILAKHKNQIHQLEALLFGQANLLKEDIDDAYYKILQKEYSYLQHKHQLKPVHSIVYFHRIRPAAFPTVRLAQLAKLIYNSNHLFSKIKEQISVQELKSLFNVILNEYWDNRYSFKETTKHYSKKIGNQMIENILINTVVTTLFAYGYYNKNEMYKNKAIQWLQELSAEKNTIINKWQSTGITINTAFDTQALLQLNKYYCSTNNCLKCAVGVKILNSTKV